MTYISFFPFMLFSPSHLPLTLFFAFKHAVGQLLLVNCHCQALEILNLDTVSDAVPTFLISTHPTLDTYKSTHSPNLKLGLGVPQNILKTGSLK